MKPFGKVVAMALGFGLLLLGLSSIPARRAKAQTRSAPVTVVNTPNVNVANTPTVDVNSLPAVAGSVSVSGPVMIGNGANAPVPTLATEVLNSFTESLHCGFGGGNVCNNDGNAPSVPAGKIAVIESLSGECDDLAGGVPIIAVDISATPAGGGGVEYPLTVPASPPTPLPYLNVGYSTTFSQNIKAYVQGGSAGMSLGLFVSAGQNEGSTSTCSANLSGYFVTAQ